LQNDFVVDKQRYFNRILTLIRRLSRGTIVPFLFYVISSPNGCVGKKEVITIERLQRIHIDRK
jgi:hypothetical protein